MSAANTNTHETTYKDAQSSNLSTICIDLDTVLAQTELKEDDLIQKHVYDTLKSRIDKRLKWVAENKNLTESSRNMPSGAGWVSFIDGTRGAGKSTFMHNTLRLLEKDDKFRQLAVVGCTDPSRIESNEVLLLTLLYALKEKVEGALKRPPQREIDNDNRNHWENAFHKVAGGLVMFQKNHDPLKELDEDLFLNIGIERAGHSAKLREHLAQLFEVACALLNAKALLFAFDDADTNSKHGIELLEVIRNYLDTPRILVLLTGDLELYSLLVRQKFRHELAQGKASEWGGQNASNDRSAQQSRMLDHLEEQYLLKLFPVQERHTLFPLWRLADETGAPTAKAKYLVKVKGQETSLITFVNDQIKTGFRLTTTTDINLYTEFFLMQPLRSVLQTLARIASVDPLNSAQAYAHEFGQAMIAMSLQNLYQANIAVDELVAENFHAMAETVFEVAMADGHPDTSVYLRPTGAEVHNRSAMFGLSAAVAQHLRGKPGTCITYLLRGPGMVKLMHDAIDSNRNNVTETLLNKEFRRYMGPGRKEDALGWARSASAALVGEYTSNPTYRLTRYGIIGLNQKGGNKGPKKVISFKTAFRAIGKSAKRYPAAAFSLVNLSGSGTKTLASIYNILGLMGKLLALTEKSAWVASGESHKKNDIFDQLLGFFPNTNSVAIPVWVQSQYVGSEEDENESGLKDDEKKLINAWVTPLYTWLMHAIELKPYIAPSSVMVGKVMPRLFYGLENISDALRINTTNYSTDFASAMELFALCVVNAFLAEESAYHMTDSSEPKRFILANPRTSATEYLLRLNDEAKENLIDCKRLPLTTIIATCPFITGLISETKAQTGWPFNGSNPDSSDQTNIFMLKDEWDELSKVAIAGSKDPTDSLRQNNSNKRNRNKNQKGDTEITQTDTASNDSSEFSK